MDAGACLPTLWSAATLAGDALTLPGAQLPRGWRARVDERALGAAFDTPQRALSSAVARGGWVTTAGFLNLRVAGDCLLDDTPEKLVEAGAAARGLAPSCVGMLTAASMRSLRLASARVEGHVIAVLVTAGLANARSAGDVADQPGLAAALAHAGTINLALASDIALSPAALAETLTTLSEAKAVALARLGVRSPVSGEPATGTGTDATAVFCPLTGPTLRYTGKHTRFGELAARLAIAALSDAVAADAYLSDAG